MMAFRNRVRKPEQDRQVFAFNCITARCDAKNGDTSGITVQFL